MAIEVVTGDNLRARQGEQNTEQVEKQADKVNESESNMDESPGQSDDQETLESDDDSAEVSEESQEEGEEEEGEEETEIESDNEDDSEDSEAEEEDEDEDDSSDEPKAKQKRRGDKLQKRINKLVKQREEARREAEALKQQLALKSNDGTTEQHDDAGDAKKAEGNSDAGFGEKPKADNYEDFDDYIDALTDWKLAKAKNEEKIEAQKLNDRQKAEQVVETFKANLNAVKQKYDDFEEIIASVDDIHPPVPLKEYFIASSNGPEMMYRLASNPEDYVDAVEAFDESRESGLLKMGELNAKYFKGKPQPSPTKKGMKRTSKAPPPVSKKVGTKGSGHSKSLSDPNLSQSEYEELMAKRAAERGRRY